LSVGRLLSPSLSGRLSAWLSSSGCCLLSVSWLRGCLWNSVCGLPGCLIGGLTSGCDAIGWLTCGGLNSVSGLRDSLLHSVGRLGCCLRDTICWLADGLGNSVGRLGDGLGYSVCGLGNLRYTVSLRDSLGDSVGWLTVGQLAVCRLSVGLLLSVGLAGWLLVAAVSALLAAVLLSSVSAAVASVATAAAATAAADLM